VLSVSAAAGFFCCLPGEKAMRSLTVLSLCLAVRPLAADGLSLDAQGFAHWLPLVLELFTLCRQLRGV
jgi:hypothetical protein